MHFKMQLSVETLTVWEMLVFEIVLNLTKMQFGRWTEENRGNNNCCEEQTPTQNVTNVKGLTRCILFINITNWRWWRTGGLEDWRTGGLEDWRTGGLEDWRTGGLEDYLGNISLNEASCSTRPYQVFLTRWRGVFLLIQQDPGLQLSYWTITPDITIYNIYVCVGRCIWQILQNKSI